MPDLEYTIFPIRKRVIKVTISNNQSTATANPHVQEIKIDHNYLLSLLGLGIDPYVLPLNTIFYDPQANAQAYSWYDGYDGTYHRWFVKTPSIGANSTYTLYMIIDTMQQLVDGNYAGINAIYGQNYLGLSYGQLDNGKNVFLIYDNFKGTTLSSIWSTFGNGTISVNNGITITVTSSQSSTGIFTSFTNVPSTGVISRTWAIVNSVGSSGGNDYELMFGNNATTSGLSGINAYASSWWGHGNTYDNIFKFVSGSVSTLAQVSDSAILNKLFYGYFMWYYTNHSYLYNYESNTNKTVSTSDTTFTLSAISQFVHFLAAPGSGTSSYTTYALAVYDAPPNGIMPAIALSFID
jgi:hypothetical protein